MSDIGLYGCRSTPLACYLKAIGVLRLVAQQVDPAACGWWEDDCFRLRTALGRNGILQFFLRDYRPTPVIAPWNGGSGFYPKDAKLGIATLQSSATPRFAAYREAIELGSRLIRERRLGERPSDQAKGALIAALRAEASAELVGWIDAAVALTLERTAFPPLLGTGGNDGRLDFTNNFMQRLTELISSDGSKPSDAAAATLESSLFGTPVAGLSSAVIGQFSPGAAGGPNSTAGFQGDSLVNGWDFVLMLEGAIVFAGAVSRRLEGANAAYLSYPFTLRAAAAGYGSASLEDEGEARGELWAPLWERPSCYPEVRALFREGRLSLGAKPARDGLDAARAVAALGVDRGITAFERFGFVKRQGLAYLATPLGRRRVEMNARGDPLNDLDRNDWLENLRRRAADEGTAELRDAVRRLDDGIFALLEHSKDHQCVQGVLIAVGAAMRAIAVRPKLQENLRPVPLLSMDWIEAANDGSSEFRLAAAMAGLRARLTASQAHASVTPEEVGNTTRGKFDLPMRAHLGPLEPGTDPPRWSVEKGGALAVWAASRLADNLCAVAERRLLERSRLALIDLPFEAAFDSATGAPIAVDSSEIAAFLDGDVRDERISELLLGLAWVRPGRWDGETLRTSLPFSYAALKPLFTPRSAFDWLKKHHHLKSDLPDLPLPPALPSLLKTGRVQEAVMLAQEAARASGLPTPFLRPRLPANHRPRPDLGRRLLAALIIPVRASVIGDCLKYAYPISDKENAHAG